jgi:putative FmdB family regulatory protein
MPFYEYQCNSCGHALEVMQKLHDAPLKKCPECGKSQLKRLMSAPVFRLKGGGWYETDFKSDQDAKRNLADRPEAPASKEEAPKEEKKGTTEAQSKDAAAPDTAKVKEKGADKPAEKAPPKAAATESAPKTAPSRRGNAVAPHKPKPKTAAKRPTRMGAKRTPAKPARRR